jgi:hypothetical protein
LGKAKPGGYQLEAKQRSSLHLGMGDMPGFNHMIFTGEEDEFSEDLE